MNFIDSTLIRIADAASRAALFDQTTLASMAGAAYDATALALQGPYAAIFDRFQLGLSVSSLGSIEGFFRMPGSVNNGELQLQLSGLGPVLPMRTDALWSGSIVARGVPQNSRITSARFRLSLTDIDAAIQADLGALPPDPTALEQERRKRFIAMMKAGMSHPNTLTDATFDAWLAQVGAVSVTDLLINHRNVLSSGVLQLGYSNPADTPASPTTLPIAAAILIRDKDASIAELLFETKMLREQLSERGIAVPAKSTLPALQPFLAVWLLPITIFDDAAWPGAGADNDALRADRRSKAAAWLGAEGIVIAPVAA